MKSLIIFYTTCTIVLYSTFVYIGFRNKNYGNPKNGVLAEVTVSAPGMKESEAKLIASHFSNAIKFLKLHRYTSASQQVYGALKILTIKEISSGNYDPSELKLATKKLSTCCINLYKGKKVTARELKELGESIELLLAQDFIFKAEKDIAKNKWSYSLTDINKAKECIIYAQKFTNNNNMADLARNRKIFNECDLFSKQVLKEMETGFLKRKLKTIDSHLEGSAG